MDPLKGGLVLCTNANDMSIGAIMMQEGGLGLCKMKVIFFLIMNEQISHSTPPVSLDLD